MENKLPTYGEFVREKRHGAGKTLREVSKNIGVSVSYLSDVERGKKGPLKPDRDIKLAKYLGCDFGSLVTLGILWSVNEDYGDTIKVRPDDVPGLCELLGIRKGSSK